MAHASVQYELTALNAAPCCYGCVGSPRAERREAAFGAHGMMGFCIVQCGNVLSSGWSRRICKPRAACPAAGNISSGDR